MTCLKGSTNAAFIAIVLSSAFLYSKLEETKGLSLKLGQVTAACESDKDYCSELEARECYYTKHKTECSCTCQNFEIESTVHNCQYGDKAPVCSSIDDYNICDYGKNPCICCQTCSATEKNADIDQCNPEDENSNEEDSNNTDGTDTNDTDNNSSNSNGTDTNGTDNNSSDNNGTITDKNTNNGGKKNDTISNKPDSILKITLDGDCNSIMNSKEKKIMLCDEVFSYISNIASDILMGDCDLECGSIIVSIPVEGDTALVEEMTKKIAEDVDSGSLVIVVDGVSFAATEFKSEKPENKMATGTLVGIIFGVLIVIGIIVIVVVVLVMKSGKSSKRRISASTI